jgi:predicted SnoaL-like aldol condensation-catalyzing enzyme
VWEEALWFLNAAKLVKSLKVVNDMAERAIKLITDCYSQKRTKNEDELQNIIQSIEEIRKRLPNASKRTFSI